MVNNRVGNANPRIDLPYGYECWIKCEEDRGRLDALLECLEREKILKASWRPSIVTWRGVMTK
jgi:RAI1 like PD-(D/E)XK nuclease